MSQVLKLPHSSVGTSTGPLGVVIVTVEFGSQSEPSTPPARCAAKRGSGTRQSAIVGGAAFGVPDDALPFVPG